MQHAIPPICTRYGLQGPVYKQVGYYPTGLQTVWLRGKTISFYKPGKKHHHVCKPGTPITNGVMTKCGV
jgi:hypothetical protein